LLALGTHPSPPFVPLPPCARACAGGAAALRALGGMPQFTSSVGLAGVPTGAGVAGASGGGGATGGAAAAGGGGAGAMWAGGGGLDMLSAAVDMHAR